MTAPHRGFSGPMKQSTKQQNTTTTAVKNPNWPEANQLAIYKCTWEVEPGTTRNKFIEWSERVLNPESPDLKASALTTGPHCSVCSKHCKIAVFIKRVIYMLKRTFCTILHWHCNFNFFKIWS